MPDPRGTGGGGQLGGTKPGQSYVAFLGGQVVVSKGAHLDKIIMFAPFHHLAITNSHLTVATGKEFDVFHSVGETHVVKVEHILRVQVQVQVQVQVTSTL